MILIKKWIKILKTVLKKCNAMQWKCNGNAMEMQWKWKKWLKGVYLEDMWDIDICSKRRYPFNKFNIPELLPFRKQRQIKTMNQYKHNTKSKHQKILEFWNSGMLLFYSMLFHSTIIRIFITISNTIPFAQMALLLLYFSKYILPFAINSIFL